MISQISNRKHITELSKIRTFIAVKNDLDGIGKLRYDSYLAEQAVSTNRSKSMVDEYDGKGNCINHVAYFDDKLIGAIRGIIYDPNSKNVSDVEPPSFKIFRDEIIKEVGLSDKIIESCRFVIHPSFKKAFHANLALIKTNCILSYAMDCTHTITAVRERHVSFYEKMGFYKCSDEKKYPGLEVKMVLLMGKNSKDYMDEFHDKFKTLSHKQENRTKYLQCLSQSR